MACGGHLYWCALFVTSQFEVIHFFKPTFWRSLLTQYAYSSTWTRFVSSCLENCIAEAKRHIMHKPEVDEKDT